MKQARYRSKAQIERLLKRSVFMDVDNKQIRIRRRKDEKEIKPVSYAELEHHDVSANVRCMVYNIPTSYAEITWPDFKRFIGNRAQ